jgi:GNAT superfamily N-acetyltransferase
MVREFAVRGSRPYGRRMAAASENLVFITTTQDDPRAMPLVAELSREYDERYEPNDGVPSSFELQRYPASTFTEAEGGVFVLLLDGEETVAGGAFKRSDAHSAEMKRVWTSSSHRRKGYARLVMDELERQARAQGYTRSTLTTGARQPEAVALYLSIGYRPLFDLAGDYERISYLEFAKDL